MSLQRHDRTYVDASRAIKAAANFPGASNRRLDVSVWYPSASARGLPLILYSHGTWDHSRAATFVTQHLAAHGYVVAAPNYPLTSCTSFTKVARPDISDVGEQIRDVSFLLDRLLNDVELGPLIDGERIGLMGHSLGAVTSYFATFGARSRDRRIGAVALTGAGDPVRAAANPHMRLNATFEPVSVPALFLSGEHDLFARMTGDPYAAYARCAQPKYQLMIRGGVHTWFHDGEEQPADGRNPDCLFFENLQPGMQVPGCEERVPLIGAKQQQALTKAAVLAFFDGYLKRDAQALAALRELGGRPEVDLTCD